MGLIICGKHGESGFNPHVSKELVDKIQGGVIVNSLDIAFVDIKFIDEDDGKEMFDIRYWMTTECFKSLSATKKYLIISDDDEKKLDEIFNVVMKGGGMCVKCFKEYLSAIGYS